MKRIILHIKAFAWAIQTRFYGSRFFLNKAIRQAVKLNRETNKRYRVFFVGQRYRAMTRDDIQRQKHQGVWDWHVNSTNMQSFCWFDTQLTHIPPKFK